MNDNNVKSNRITWVDFGKGFAVFLVVLGHVALGSLESDRFSGTDVVILHYLLEATYAIHIPVFFALSGFFLKPFDSISELIPHTAKRLISLSVPYIIFSVVMVILKSLGGNSVRNQDGLFSLINIYKQPIDYLWFLYALFFIDLFVGILSVFVKSKRLTVIVIIIGFIVQTQFNFSNSIVMYVLLWSPFYYLGFLLRKISISKNIAMLSLIIYVIHVPLFVYLYPNSDYLSGYWRIISVFGVLMMFYYFQHATSARLSYRFLEWCGLGSIVIYLIHAPVVSVIRIAMFKIGITEMGLQLVIQFVISVLCSVGVLYLADRINFVNLFFRPLKALKPKS